MQRFTDKTVIVTGASSGIGHATATRFASEGARVVILDIAEGLDDIAAAIEGDVTARTLDVRDSKAVTEAIDAIAADHGAIHVLHNNAGVAVMKSPADHSDEDWDKVMRTNVDGTFHCSRAALPHLEKTQGCIVNTSSVSGLRGDWGMLAYNTSKGAISNFTRALALDLGEKGIRVNAVAPSVTDTPLAQGIVEDEEQMAKFAERMPLQPPEHPEDIAAVVAFLASEDARMVTGVILPVDGGISASNGQPAQI